MKKLVSILTIISVMLLLLPNSVTAVQIGDPAFADPDYTEIKQMLLDLGMGAYFVERMTNEQLERIANAQGISCMTQQIPIDGNIDGDVSSPNGLILPGGPIVPDEPDDYLATYSEFSTDDYMTMYLLVIKLTEYNYLMSIDIQWDQIPSNRLTDSLGICASRLGMVNSTRSGWFDYRGQFFDGTIRLFSYTFTDSNFKNADISGDWSGSVAVFDFDDIIISYPPNDPIEMYAHYEFEMSSGSTPELRAINVTATYDHMVQSFSIDNSISIGTDGIGFNLTPNLSYKFHRRSISLPEPINYIPT